MNFIRHPELPHGQPPEIGHTIYALLAARAANAAAGNRRALYARMDALLGGADGEQPVEPPRNVLPEGGHGVRLSRMQLRNWKAFARADLVLPAPQDDRALVVIGGSNGFGKSSILEAFAFALFGRRALTDIGFLIDSAGGRRGQRRSYRLHLERALHRSERARDDGMCSVSLDFETADGPIGVERKWYFDERGGLIEEDEELVLRVGPDRQPLDLPPDVIAREWYQSEIERRIMPASLAPFFVFDGEQVERWAERQLSEQIRMAISSMLGLEELSGLSDDLKSYSRDRERNTGGAATASADILSAEIDRLQKDVDREKATLVSIEKSLDQYRLARDEALAKLAGTGVASHAELQTRLETEHRLTGERHRLKRELIGRVAELGPLLLVGERLQHRVIDGLDADARVASAGGIEAEEIELLWQRFINFEPPLPPEVASSLRDRYLASYLPADDQGALAKRYPFLERSTRRGVRTILKSVEARSRERLEDVCEAIARLDDQLARLSSAQIHQAQQATLRATIQAELGEITGHIENGERQRGAVRQQLEALLAELMPRLEARDRYSTAEREAQPRLRAAAAARAIASLIDAHRERIADLEHERFAEAVTSSFYALSHKKQIARIEIGTAGAIALFDEAGRDVTDYRLSAGESQLFALALIAAVGTLIGDRLPLIVDTPLGRLDTQHRHSVLQLFGARRAQTILLTQPEEISAAHLAMLAPVLAGSTQIEHQLDPVSGIGVSNIVRDDSGALDAA